MIVQAITLPGQDISTETMVWFDSDLSFEVRAEQLVKAMTLDEKISQTMDQAPAIDRLGIPEYNWWNEALHGVARNGRATVFPQAIGLAATFDIELMKQIGDAISTEARIKYNTSVALDNRGRYAGLTFWSPNVNIFRDPRWGRGQETYGEDPYLSGKMGVAFVKGIQGNDLKYLKAAACAKHYLVHSGPEELRHEFDAVVSQKDLYETYLPAFEALVREGKVEGVMGAYNRVLSEPACGSKFFLNDLLRKQWGFDGYVVSDCGAIADFHRFHKVTSSAAESSALAIKSGLNLNCGRTFVAIKEAIEKGLMTEDELDNALTQLYMTRFRLGFFDELDKDKFGVLSTEKVDGADHRRLAREAATKSLVLLKNKDNLLPLKKELKSIYVVGPHATSEEILLGNYYGLTANTVSILDGIVGQVSPGTSINYKLGQLAYQENINPIDWSTGEAKNAEVMIAVMGISGLLEGEEGEALASAEKGDRRDIRLPQNQIDYIKKLKKETATPLVLIITGGSPIALPEIEPLADAILFAWYPGEEGGNAVADVLFGNASPSGKLPVTFPFSVDGLPAFDDYAMKGRTYKYMQTEPQFPFGFGLSYATFSFSQDQVVKVGNDLIVNVAVSNMGSHVADEVVQLYVSSPLGGEEDPISSLRAFQRVHLAPGETSVIGFHLNEEDFYQFDMQGDQLIRKGEYKVSVGNSSPGSRATRLGAKWVEYSVNATRVFKN